MICLFCMSVGIFYSSNKSYLFCCSFITDYEEITLDDSDNEPDPDGYELVELPDAQDINGTKMCQCNCHKNTLDQNYLKRNRHCYSCCLKVSNDIY
jgi:hypothetical protein